MKGINGYFDSLDCSSVSTNSKMFIAYLLFPLEWIEKHDVEQKLGVGILSMTITGPHGRQRECKQ